MDGVRLPGGDGRPLKSFPYSWHPVPREAVARLCAGNPADGGPREIEAAGAAARLEERLRRSMADYDNLVKKTRSEIEDGVNAGVDKVLREILVIRDELGLAAVAAGPQNPAGITAIVRKMDSLLEANGVRGIEAIGKKFDPRIHESVSSVVNPSVVEGTITREIRRGYFSKSGVLRPSMVEVSTRS